MKIANVIYSMYIGLVLVFQQQENNLPEIVGDILEPEPLQFTFETIGWKVLAFLFTVIACIFFYKWFKLYRKNKYRREAIKKLIVIESENTENHYKINQLNIVLKQVAIVTFGREEVAKLYGNDWFLFLDSKSKHSNFMSYANNFTDAIYRNKIVDKSILNTIHKLTKTWINEHS